MMRHAAGADGVTRALGWPPEKVARFILGHGESRGEPHAPVEGPRLAFVPLPSIESRDGGRIRVVGSIRRALVVILGEGAMGTWPHSPGFKDLLPYRQAERPVE